MEITNNTLHNKELSEKGFVKIGKLDPVTFGLFKKKSCELVNRFKASFPKGELFNFINGNLDLKKESNEMVGQFMNPYLEDKLDTALVDIYPVSHIVKPFGMKSGIWHQDAAIVNENTDFSLNAWTPFVNSTRLNGCLWVIPGSHKLKNFKRQFGFNPIDADFLKKIRRYMIPLEVKAGEVLLFHRNILHGSSRNWLPMSRIAAESVVTSKNAQFVNFHRDEEMYRHKVIEFKVSTEHFLKANPKEDFYSGETPYILHDDESKEEIRQYILSELPNLLK